MAKIENLDKLLEPLTHARKTMLDYRISSCLKCAVELGIPDVMHKHGKPMTLSELTSALPINPSKSHYIHRLMSSLVKTGFFAVQNESYALTPSSHLILKDNPMNIRSFLFMTVDPVMMKPWNFLAEWFQNDDNSPFVTAHRKNLWDLNAQDPLFGKLFNESMANDSELITEVLVKECKYVFDGLTSLVDVGGGTGSIASAIARSFPDIKCTVYDLPQVIANQEGTDNLDFVAGNMFEKIPSANAILLKWILHNWSDEDCVKILKNCRNAIPQKDKGGKVLIIELVVENHKEENKMDEAELSFDLEMMVIFGTKERSKDEWEKIFKDAGFDDYKIFPVLAPRCIIELYP